MSVLAKNSIGLCLTAYPNCEDPLKRLSVAEVPEALLVGLAANSMSGYS
jgi:hypothetical protein